MHENEGCYQEGDDMNDDEWEILATENIKKKGGRAVV